MTDFAHLRSLPRVRLEERVAVAEARLSDVRESLAKATEERDAARAELRQVLLDAETICERVDDVERCGHCAGCEERAERSARKDPP